MRSSALRILSTLVLAALISATVMDSAPLIAEANSFDRPPECSDSIDNDRDQKTDADDEDCLAPEDDRELVEPERDTLVIHISDGKQFAEPNEILTYHITVENPSGHERDFALQTDLNPALILLEASDAPRIDNRRIEWRNEKIGAGEVRDFYLTAYVERAAPDLTAVQVRVYAKNANVATDTTSIRMGIGNSDFSVSVSDSEDSVLPGEKLTYAIVIRNSANRLATEVEVNNALPMYAEFVEATEGGQWTGKNVRWNGLTISPQGERRLQVTARIRRDAPLGAELRNTVEVRGNSAVDVTKVSDQSEPSKRLSRQRRLPLELTKAADRSEVQPGNIVRYTIRLRNNTDRPFSNIDVQDRLDMRYMHLFDSNDAQQAHDRLRWMIPVLEPGQEWVTNYQVQIAPSVPHGYSLNNVVSVSGDGFESISLTERVYTSSIGIVTDLPKTGAGIGGIFLALTSILGMGSAFAQKKFLIG